jgi:WD40 repeat protein
MVEQPAEEFEYSDPEQAKEKAKKDRKKTKVANNVVVKESEFKHSSTHSDVVTGIVPIDDCEFFTSSKDQSLRVWDKYTQGVTYTVETHDPLSVMGITGEKGEILVCGLGEGHLVVFGKERKNQLDIVEYAHAQPITQIVSLSGIKNKYFATRCGDGHVNIYSSLAMPDRIAQLFNFDGDAEALAHLQHQPEPEEVKTDVKKKKKGSEDGSDVDDDEDDAAPDGDDDDDEEKKDTKPKIMPPVAPLLVGRPEPSDRDMMIEVRSKSPATTSSTHLAVACFNECQVIICKLDIKTRTRVIKQTFKTRHNPTYLYQIDEDSMLVGTIEGTFEVWNIKATLEEPTLQLVINAHPNTKAGISNIIRLQDPSPMIVGSQKLDEDSDILVSTAGDQENIMIWHLKRQTSGVASLSSYININTSFSNGIKYII